MCVLPKIKAPKIPPMVERQAVQTPKDAIQTRTSISAKRRRGMWASIFTSPRGALGAPITTAGPPTKLG